MSSVPKRVARSGRAEPDVDAREHRWWNDNAPIVSKIWEMHDDVSGAFRRPYLNRAKRFLQASGASATILEMGCGSGWVGQMIAGSDLKIVGTDFSESQIGLANANAKRKNLSPHCTYSVSSPDLPLETDGVDGVLIHCFLHHLNGEELDALLSDLRTSLSAGTRVWIYEPAFYSTPAEATSPPAITARILLAIATRVVSLLGWLYSTFDLLDTDVDEEFALLAAQAENEGWYLTPKEVPLDVDGFSEDVGRLFEVREHYWATIYLVGWVYQTNLLKSGLLRRVIGWTVMPLLVFVDRRLSLESAFLRSELVAPNYAFRVWECIAR